MKKLTGQLFVIPILASLAACSTEVDQQEQDQLPAPEVPPASAQVQAPPTPMNLNGQIAFARKDLAKKLDITIDSIALSSANKVTWRSGALGCPEPGMAYTEALVPGVVIYLKAGEAIHAYHARFAGEPFYCPKERVEPPALEEGLDHT